FAPMRALSIAAVCGLFSIAVHAQGGAPVRNDTMHLTVNASISASTIAAGDKVSLRFDVIPKRAMHVYAPGKHDYQVIAVKLDPQPWLKVAPTAYPPSEIYHFKELDEKVETYGKPFTLVQDVTVLNTAVAKKALAAAPVRLTGKLEYQACDDKVCYAPTRVPVSFELTVK
ncbi:MAG TPA: protein-disulfide reductase DsbD domain-containing protein, partial [Vicinamibacterales bacterium]|nr:protein-disulfide reductase DsbD domain-containing protein [Vicinamibacterales bacterium]